MSTFKPKILFSYERLQLVAFHYHIEVSLTLAICDIGIKVYLLFYGFTYLLLAPSNSVILGS
jgi:hypothetical protein